MTREITARTRLTRPDGRLNADAVGWARHPLIDTSGIGRGRGRNKRWEYWNVITPTHVLALTVSSIDYAAVHEVWIFDRATQRTWSRSATLIPPRGVELPASMGDGPARARAKNLRIDVDELPPHDPAGPGTRLRAKVPGASFDVVATLDPGHERLAVVVPWTPTRFQYTVKDVARPASGSVTIGAETFDVPAGQSWAVLDHGRGRWFYDVQWNWGAGSGISGGRTIGVQVGGKWTDGTGMTENAVFVDGRIHWNGAELSWEYDRADFMAPWRVRGGGLDLTFRPFYDKVSRTNLGVLAAATDQCFGHWSGSYVGDGVAVEFDGITGFAEHVHNRW